MSWVHQPRGYHLLCNRDEKRTRGEALAPRIVSRAGVRFIAPSDSEFGGTWLAVNEYGISFCLLNKVGQTSGSVSRGWLVRELAWADSSSEAALAVKQLDLRRFAGFTLAVLEPGRQATLAEWDGRELTIDPAGDSHMPLTSSSYDSAGVRQARLNDFAQRVRLAGRIDADVLYWLHASHGNGPDAYSTCMHRPDAQTVSFSWITVTADTIRFLYSPAAPCQSSPSQQLVLARAA